MKIKELLALKEEKRVQALALAQEGKVDEAKALKNEIETIQAQIEVLEGLEEEVKETIQNKAQGEPKNMKNKSVEAFKNFVAGKKLTEDMKNAIVTSEDGAALIPTELVTQLQEKRAQLVSLKEYVTTIPVSAPSGTVPIENDTNALLVDFDEGDEVAEQGLSFTNKAFTVASKGAIVPVTKQLLADSQFGMPEIIQKNFVKKAVRTENADIIDALKTGNAKQLKSVAELNKSINRDLDPAALIDGVIVLGATTYDKLEAETDQNGRSLITPNPADEKIKMYKGLQVVVLSDAELPVTGTQTKKQPMFYGSLDGVIFLDKEGVEVSISEHAGFRQNAILYKAIERYDVVAGVANHIYAEFDVTDAVQG